MYTFHAIDRFSLRGSPWLGFVVENPEDHVKIQEGAWKHLLNHVVTIDGDLYRVKAVESFCITHIRAGMTIGLLVERVVQ